MNVWMKRGLQTALITGGLLTLGTGLAAADDDTIAVTVPVTVTDNALAVLGTTPGSPAEIELPALDGTVAADLGGLAVAVPITIGGNDADAGGLDVAQPAAAPAPGGLAGSGGTAGLDGAAGSGGAGGPAIDVDVPLTVTGNAVAILGNASGDAPADSGSAPTEQPGTGESEASLLDADAPVLVCGTAIGVLGDAAASCTAPADAPSGATGGTTSAVGVDAPVSVCGIGVGLLGGATTSCTAPAAPLAPESPTPTVPAVIPASGQPGAAPGVVPAVAALSMAADGSTGAQAVGATAGADRTLAYTGSAVLPALLGGLVAVCLGLGLTVLGRRRVGALG